MTTIAFKGDTLAADLRETNSNWIEPTSTPKITRLKDGSLFGAAGDSDQCAVLLAATNKGKAPGDLDNVNGLLIKPDRSIWRFAGKVWDQLITPYYAIGSGSIPASVAMRLGLGAEEAVKIAIEFDHFSGGGVTTLKLKKPKRAKRK